MALLLVVTIGGADQLWQFVALAAATGVLGALGNPAGRSLVPELVPAELLTGALALRSIAGQIATIGGPAIGGLLFALKPEAVYAAAIVLCSSLGAALAVRAPRPSARRPAKLDSLLGGVRFIRGTPSFGAITLDLFAVLFGGAVALLPLFAQSIPHRPVRARRAPQHGRGRRAARRRPARAQAARRPRGRRCCSSSGCSARA